MANNSIGLIELGSIAAGFEVADAMLKAAAVELVLARTICSGKYMVLVRGDVAAIQASVAAGVAAGSFSVIDSFSIPNVDESIFPAIAGIGKVEALEALGIIESFSVASLIEGADAAVKAANVKHNEIRQGVRLADRKRGGGAQRRGCRRRRHRPQGAAGEQGRHPPAARRTAERNDLSL
jgi:microcompartment protein CcmL/EutN